MDLPDGSSRSARQHVHYLYDQDAPNGDVFDLVTTTTVSAAPLDGSTEQDSRTTSNVYAIGADQAGWMLGTPLQVTVDPGASPHLNLTTTTKYDTTTGNLTARILPANPSGGDAHETDFLYYTADAGSADSDCRSHPEWAGLPCKQTQAAQPGTAGLPNLATKFATKYNMYRQLEQTIDYNGFTARTTSIGYDAAGRPTTNGVNGSSGTGSALPTITTGYDSSSGLATTSGDGTRTITRSFDNVGRLTSYADADSNTSSYTYDLLDRLSTVNDGKATTTYTYDDVGAEKRGLPTTLSDSSIGTFTAVYNADAQIASQTYPGGLTAAYTYDESGEPTDLKFSKGTGFWPDSTARYNVHGERTAMTSDLFTYRYQYDRAARLTNTYEQNIFGCVNRGYTFDADTNRTALTTTVGVTWNSNPTNCPPTGSGTTTSYAYDSADRITGTGYSYDAFGRTTAIPGANSPNAHATTTSYYVNDLAKTIASNGVALTYNLDPNRRVRTWSSSVDSQTHTNHFTGDSDGPAWTTENTAGTNWTRNLSAFNGMAAQADQTGTVTLQLMNIHGDRIGPAATTDTTWNLSAPQSETREYGQAVGGTGIRYDYLGSAQRQRDTNSGLQLMGARVYNPATGRFLQTDQVTAGSANEYDYVAGDPVNKVDLAGTCSWYQYSRWWGGTSDGNANLFLCIGWEKGVLYFSLRLTELMFQYFKGLNFNAFLFWYNVCSGSATLRKNLGPTVSKCMSAFLYTHGSFFAELAYAIGSEAWTPVYPHAERCLVIRGWGAQNYIGVPLPTAGISYTWVANGFWGTSTSGLGSGGNCNAGNWEHLSF